MTKRPALTRPLAKLATLAAAALLATAAQAGPVLDRIQSSGIFKMGYRADGAPFSWLQEQGGSSAVAGYATDICRRIADGIAAHLRIARLQVLPVAVLQSARMAAVINGDIDMECASTTNTQERRKQVAFGLTYFYTGAALLTASDSGITSLKNFRDQTLGVIEGTTGQLIAQMHAERSGGWQIRHFPALPEAVAALNKGDIQAVMDDDVPLLAFAAQSGGKLAVAQQRYSVEPLAPMFSKADPELEQLVRNIMQNLFRSGEMDAIYKRWFLSPLPGLGYNLNLKMGTLLRDSLRRPTDYVADWTVM